MRLLALTWKHPSDPTAGGAERFLLEVTRRWVGQGHEVTVFGPAAPSVPLSSGDSERRGAAYVGRGSRLTVFRHARKYLRTQGMRYDRVLETVSTKPFGASRVVGPRALAYYHQTAEDVWNLEFPFPVAIAGRYLLEPRWVRWLQESRVVANSPSTAAALRRFGLECLAVIPPGCDGPVAWRPRAGPSAGPKLLWIGRMVRTKRPADAIAAFADLRKDLPSARLDMVGTGYLYHQLKDANPEGVLFHGQVSEFDKQALLAQADVLLLPGTREGWGIVAMEAAAFGVPVVAYDIPGVRDSVVNGTTGAVVAPNPQALSTAALRILTDTRLWSHLSVSAHDRASIYTWDRTAADLLAELLNLDHPGPAARKSALQMAGLRGERARART